MFVMPDRRIAVRVLAAFALAALVAACAAPAAAPPADKALLTQQVTDTERAFARTMAERDLAAFASFVADEAVFFDGATALRGKAAVVAAWEPLFTAPTAPFSWAPEQIEVLPSGTLALSSGPVFAPSGKKVASFTSIWRLEAPGVWRIVFDKGCDCPPP
jgi:ketosteroid isomerase-like protein